MNSATQHPAATGRPLANRQPGALARQPAARPAVPVPARPSGSATSHGVARPVVDVSVVIPVYNERHRLAATLAEVCAHLRARGGGWELIVVDDGSADDSATVADRFADTEPGVTTLRGHRNRGKGHAVRRGVLASSGRRVLYCDADLATPIGELDRLLAELDRGDGLAAAIGSRVGPGATIEVRQPAARILLGRLGNRLIRAAAVPGIGDTQCGFKAFDGAKARRVFPLTRMDGWGFDVEVLYLCARNGWPVAEVPVRWSHRSGSKVRPLDYPATLADLIRMRLHHRNAPRIES